MKFLIDNALPPRLAHLLVAAGYDAVPVGAYGMHAAPDEEIPAKPFQEDRVVVSADTDFGVILGRDPNLLRAQDYANMLISVMSTLAPELAAGCVAVFRNGRLRVRRLPLSDEYR